MIYFSKSEQGFYHDNDIDILPDDAYEITEDVYRDILAKHSETGLPVLHGPSGMPETPPTHYHTLNSNGDAWEITPENQKIIDDMNATEYQRKRQAEYPLIGDQLDMIYHDIDNWKAEIQKIKDKYPKP